MAWLMPFAPRSRFCPVTDRRSGARPQASSNRSPSLDAAFHSPAARAGLATRSRSRVNTPGLHLRNDPIAAPKPVRPRAPVPVRPFIASRDTINARDPLPGSTKRFSVCLRAAAPLQDFSILKDRNAQPDSNRKRLPLRVARSSFAPRFALIFLVPPRNGSTFQIRYFPSALAAEVVRRGLNVRATERLVQRRSTVPFPKPRLRAADTLALERQLSVALGLRVTLEPKKRGGSLTLHYASLDQLDRVLSLLRAG